MRRVVATALVVRHTMYSTVGASNKFLQTREYWEASASQLVALIAAARPLLLEAFSKTTSERAHVLGRHAPTTVRTECVGNKDALLCQGAAIVQNPHL